MTVDELVLQLQKVQKDGLGNLKVVRSDNSAYVADGAEDIYNVSIKRLVDFHTNKEYDMVVVGG